MEGCPAFAVLPLGFGGGLLVFLHVYVLCTCCLSSSSSLSLYLSILLDVRVPPPCLVHLLSAEILFLLGYLVVQVLIMS